MAFGQQSGPPASKRQIDDLLRLLARAGHDGFRDARGPLGLSQRQAGGRFTRQEAEELIARLEHELDGVPDADTDTATATATATDTETAPGRGPAAADGDPSGVTPLAATQAERRRQRQLRAVPDAELAAELQRRGWVVMQP